jgi:hypothetical protein
MSNEPRDLRPLLAEAGKLGISVRELNAMLTEQGERQ